MHSTPPPTDRAPYDDRTVSAAGAGDPAPRPRLRAGQRVAERYRLEACLGQGTTGEVWSAREGDARESNRAIKFLRPELAADPEARRLFAVEQRILARLAHTNLVYQLDRGEWQGRSFLVTEYTPGSQPMRVWLCQQRRPAAELLARVFSQICAGVSEAHALGIVHRDLKPENVLLDFIQVKVLDFGLARLCSDDPRPGQRVGTPRYTSPEQALGQEHLVGPWSDVFALGVMLHEALTGRASPARGKVTWQAVLEQTPAALLERSRRRRPDIHARVWEVLERCLQPEGERRFASARSLRNALAMAWQALAPPVDEDGAITEWKSPRATKQHELYRQAIEPHAILARDLGHGQRQVLAVIDLGLTLGSAPECDVRLDELRPYHASVAKVGRRYLLHRADPGGQRDIDLASAVELDDGDTIQLVPDVTLQFQLTYAL